MIFIYVLLALVLPPTPIYILSDQDVAGQPTKSDNNSNNSSSKNNNNNNNNKKGGRRHSAGINIDYNIKVYACCSVSALLGGSENKENADWKSVKEIKKDGLNIDSLNREISLLKNFEHGNIISLFDVFENETVVYLIIDRLPKDSLLDWISKTSINRGETKNHKQVVNTAQGVCSQLLDVVDVCSHKKGDLFFFFSLSIMH